MPSIANVTRRGAVYHWRRRLPGPVAKRLAISHVSVSLRIREQPAARALAGHLDAVATMLFTDPTQGGTLISKAQVTAIFREAADIHLQRMDRIAAWKRSEPDFDAARQRRSDTIMSWCYTILAGRGETARVDDEARSRMTAAGLSERDCNEVDWMLDVMRAQGLVPHHPGRLRDMLHAVGAAPHDGNTRAAQTAIYRGYAAALRQTERRWDGLYVEDDGLVDAMLREPAHVPAEPLADLKPRQTIPAAHEGRAVPAPAPAILADADLPETAAPVLVDRSGPHPLLALGIRFADEKVKEGNWDAKARNQAVQTYGLFARLLVELGVHTLEAIEQKHLSKLKETFGLLAKSYGKSPADQDRTIATLIRIGGEKPAAQRGLEPTTQGRHFSHLQELVDWLRANGIPIRSEIAPRLLKPKKKERGRSRRSTLSTEDLSAIFHFAFFEGCAGWRKVDSFTPGDEVYHRALYFALLMLHYMGARREEICGLDVADIGVADGMPFIHIRDNAHRTLKNAQSERLIPLHPEVLRLGFLDYVEAVKKLGYARVFPDLHSGTTDSPSGDKLYDELIEGIKLAIPEEGRRKKVIHSLRKTFGAELKRKKVDPETRADLLGHGGKTATDEIYVDPAELRVMLDEMLKIPIITGHLQRRTIRLVPWVAEKKRMPYSGRKPGARRRRAPVDLSAGQDPATA